MRAGVPGKGENGRKLLLSLASLDQPWLSIGAVRQLESRRDLVQSFSKFIWHLNVAYLSCTAFLAAAEGGGRLLSLCQVSDGGKSLIGDLHDAS